MPEKFCPTQQHSVNFEYHYCFVIGFGQFFGKDWIHVQSDEYRICEAVEDFAQEEYNNMLDRALDHVRSMDRAHSGARVCIMHTRLDQLTLRTCVMWKNSRENGVKLEVLQDPSFDDVSGEWTGFNVDVGVSAHYFHNSIGITVHRI